MYNSAKNSIEFKVWGRNALFADPLTRLGGEKCSYHVPTYEALKGVAKSIYWKPTLVWIIDEVRIMKPFRTQTKGTKPLVYHGSNSTHSLAIYTFLADVEYQVRAHFEWNVHRKELIEDRIDGKHYEIAKRMLKLGGRQDIFLGTRDCQGYVEPCEFGSGSGFYDNQDELSFGLMFHGFDYPDETGTKELYARFWRPTMIKGIIQFASPGDQRLHKKFVRNMDIKQFGIDQNHQSVEKELMALGEIK